MKVASRDIICGLAGAALGAGLAVMPLIHERVSTEAIVGFMGAALGSGLALIGAVVLVHYQRRAVEREEVAVIDHLLKQAVSLADLAVRRSAADEHAEAQGAFSLSLDNIDTAKRILSRSTVAHIGLVNTEHSLGILTYQPTLRMATELTPEQWAEAVAPKLAVLAAALKMMRDALHDPSLREDIENVRFTPFTGTSDDHAATR